MLVSENNHMQA